MTIQEERENEFRFGIHTPVTVPMFNGNHMMMTPDATLVRLIRLGPQGDSYDWGELTLPQIDEMIMGLVKMRSRMSLLHHLAKVREGK